MKITMPDHSISVYAYYSELSKQYQCDFVNLNLFDLDLSLLKKRSRGDYIKLRAIPISQTETTVTIATAEPSAQNKIKIEAFFTKQTTKKVKLVLASIQDITHVLAEVFKNEYAHEITHCRDEKDLFHSASYTFSLKEKLILFSVLIIFILGAFGNFFVTALCVNVFLATGTLIIMSHKMGLTIHALRLFKKRPKGNRVIQNELPMYTILLPMLREKESTIVLLLEAISKLDYPKDKLDIKFLLEKDDQETLDVLQKFVLPWNYQTLLVPDGLPRSKPRACNYGLQFSLGEYLTIFDAEDRPDSDQLKAILHQFINATDKVACIQAALNFYNYKQNIITRLFTIEYTYWFDCLIPALDMLRAPVPLGGTSNHFKTDVVKKIGGWDPFIGTEDAEIGVRLYRYGYRVEVSRSTTYEEANTRFINWFLQRVRWNKGYMQTYLVNMRDPIKMIRQIGPWRFINFQFFVGGNVFIQLANLPLWIFLCTTLLLYNQEVASLYPTLIFRITLFNFIVSNGILLISQFVAVWRRRLYCLLPFVPLKIFYWMAMSLAGYYAIFELLIRPGYWYKTTHGLGNQGDHTDVPKT